MSEWEGTEFRVVGSHRIIKILVDSCAATKFIEKCQSFEILFLFLMYECFTCTHIMNVYAQCLRKSEDSVIPSGIGGTVDCELP